MESSQAVQSVNHSSGTKSSPFDRLPDEMVLKIIKMAVDGFGNEKQPLCQPRTCRHTFHLHQQKYEFLINTIAKISGRFKRIATDKTLWANWNGGVAINEYRKKELEDLLEILGTFCRSLAATINFIGLSSKDIVTMADKCPKLEHLNLGIPKILSWPKQGSCRFASLITMFISIEDQICSDVQLHLFMPNIEIIEFHGKSLWENLLPDMSHCERLRVVYLYGAGALYTFPGKIPFPQDLRELRVSVSSVFPSLIDCDKESLENHFENCDISSRIGFREKRPKKYVTYSRQF